MKRPGYREAIEWIALNDSPADHDPPEILAGLVTVVMVSHLWGKSSDEVGRDVSTARRRLLSPEPARPQAGRATIAGDELLARVRAGNPGTLPALVEISGKRYALTPKGYAGRGPARGDEVLVLEGRGVVAQAGGTAGSEGV